MRFAYHILKLNIRINNKQTKLLLKKNVKSGYKAHLGV